MATVTYIARRSLLVGVSAGATIVLTLAPRYASLPLEREPKSFNRTSLAGNREGYYYRGEVSWLIDTIPLATAAADAMRQFLDSVEDGQIFSFAPYTPIVYRNVQRELVKYTAERHQSRQDMTVFSFRLIEVP